jgi:hypothetical protein
MPEEYVGDHGHECMMMFFRAPVAESPRQFISLPAILDARPAHTGRFPFTGGPMASRIWGSPRDRPLGPFGTQMRRLRTPSHLESRKEWCLLSRARWS